MNRAQLAHVLRAAAVIVEDIDILVLGSQAILGSFDAEVLPDEATQSIEADIAFWDDEDEAKADHVDGLNEDRDRRPDDAAKRLRQTVSPDEDAQRGPGPSSR